MVCSDGTSDGIGSRSSSELAAHRADLEPVPAAVLGHGLAALTPPLHMPEPRFGARRRVDALSLAT